MERRRMEMLERDAKRWAVEDENFEITNKKTQHNQKGHQMGIIKSINSGG